MTFRGRGMALITTLLFVSVLVMMMVGLVQRSLIGGHFAIEGQRHLGAQAAAEAGLAEVLSRLSENPNWATDLVDQPLQQSDGRFSVRWSAPQSINNLTGTSPKNSKLGTATVPAGQALVVVTGQRNGVTHQIEALVGGVGLLSTPQALLSTGSISLGSDVTVMGLSSLADPIQVDADVVCTKGGPASNLIQWSGSGEVNIRGAVRSNGGATSISSNFSTGNITRGMLTGESGQPPAKVDIAGKIGSHTGSTPLTVTGTSTALPAGDYYLGGNLNYAGDLDLQGANLYVDGDINLTGTVKGKGTLFVSGSTKFFGDSQVLAGDGQQVALYSKGDVNLSGYDGTTTLRAVATAAGSDSNGVAYNTHIDNMIDWTHQLSLSLDRGPAASALYVTAPGSKSFGNAAYGPAYTSDFDYFSEILALPLSFSNYRGVPRHKNFYAPVSKLKQMVDSHTTPGPSRDFLLKQLGDLKGAGNYDGVLGLNSSKVNAQNAVDQALASGHPYNMLDAFNDLYNDSFLTSDLYKRQQMMGLLKGTLAGMDLKRPGTAFFRGLVYTEGNFTAENDITLQGALYAIGASSNVNLQDMVTIQYVPELAQRAGETLGNYGVKMWLRR